MSEYHDDRTRASDPLPLKLSLEKLQRIEPNLFGASAPSFQMQFHQRTLDAPAPVAMFAEHLRLGDSRAAVVVQTRPLIVAPYTDEQDTILLLRFDDWLAGQYSLRQWDRLLTINTYGRGPKLMRDIIEGPASTGRYCNFYPFTAEFLSDDLNAIQERQSRIPEAEWTRTKYLARDRMASSEMRIRDGRPTQSRLSGKLFRKIQKPME